MSMEHCWNNNDRGRVKNSEKNLSQCQFVHHKSDKDRLNIEPVPPREVSVVIRTHTSVGLNYEDNKFQINGSSCVSCNTRTDHLNGRHSSFWSSFMIRAFDALRINYNIMNWPHRSQHTVRAGGYGRYCNIRWARILQHARPSRQNSELHIQHGKCNVRSENGWASGKLHIRQLSSIIVVSKVMICRFQLLWSTLFSLT